MSKNTQTEMIDSSKQDARAYKAADGAVAVRPSMGGIKMNNDLLPTIAIYAALETRGVVSLSGKHKPSELTNRRDAERGVSTALDDKGRVTVALEIDVEFGHNIYDTCLRCQQHVKNAIEHMTGFVVEKVEISVRGVVPQQTPPIASEEAGFPR